MQKRPAGMPSGCPQGARTVGVLRRHAAESGVLPVDATNHCGRSVAHVGLHEKPMHFSRSSGGCFSTPEPETAPTERVDPIPGKQPDDGTRRWNISRAPSDLISRRGTPEGSPQPTTERPLPVGRWVVVNPKGLLVRAHEQLSSAERGTVPVQTVVKVVEVRGRRGRIAGAGGVPAGWVSLRAADGHALAEPADDASPSPARTLVKASPQRQAQPARPATAPAPRAAARPSPEPLQEYEGQYVGDPQAKPGEIRDDEDYFHGLNASPMSSPEPLQEYEGQYVGDPQAKPGEIRDDEDYFHGLNASPMSSPGAASLGGARDAAQAFAQAADAEAAAGGEAQQAPPAQQPPPAQQADAPAPGAEETAAPTAPEPPPAAAAPVHADPAAVHGDPAAVHADPAAAATPQTPQQAALHKSVTSQGTDPEMAEAQRRFAGADQDDFPAEF
eukprot:TRINITY_DN6850_c0_g2_i2.p1 TRINITY_DN6850_c0_g2~~TRINITY_DN6850_c0_g2_i2.p1  ORF type:complete len:475 (+),score=123.13 TRINITY_DN6850_c0_g2_i2:94-1425(+)